MALNAYDEVPYSSYYYYKTSIESLYTISTLFEIDAPDYKNCKVLELGCSSGGNIIPVAFKYPQSQFIGIDFSKTEIEKGQQQISKLEIDNIELKHLSIMDIDDSFGIFDYIIVHGVISWVSEEIQNKIFDICSKNLAKNGIAYISYNTLPGWNMLKTIRDMMLYHTDSFNTPKEKVNQSRLLLEFIKEGIKDKNTPYSLLLDSESNYLSKQSDYYIIHEHLENDNNPFYFHEFISKTNKHNLKYIGDVSLSSMYLGNLPENISKKLKSISHDIVRTEQYMDFVSNRRFRSSILCHESTHLNRNLNNSRISLFSFISILKAEQEVTNKDILNKQNIVYKSDLNTTFSTNNPIILIMLRILQQNAPNVTKASNLIDSTFAKAKEIFKKESIKKEEIENIVFNVLMRLVFANCMRLFSDSEDNFINNVSKYPSVSKLTRVQALSDEWVTTERGSIIRIDLFTQTMIQYLDGKNTIEEIIEKMILHVLNKEIVIEKENNIIEDINQVKKYMKKNVIEKLDILVSNTLIIS